MDADAARGVLLGLACGDALGRPVEFRSGAWITDRYGTVTDMHGQGSHGQPAGTITDDTELAMCIARSLVENDGFDGEDVADRFLKWYHSDPFDIGMMTADAIRRYKQGATWQEAGEVVWQHRSEGQNAGNGSVMRCVPHAIAFGDDFETLGEVSRQSSAITHYDPRCTEGCTILNLTVAGLLEDAETPLQDALDYVRADAPDGLMAALQPVARGDSPDTLETSGYVVHSLQTALHDELFAESAEAAIVSGVNRGGGTDTIGAIAGAIAGARFGASQLPDRWLSAIDETDELGILAAQLLEVA
jgi:ADP-ribosyl-[dinitrogen reductase] hydrolase